ncbi:hypothetical protein RHGRI_014129 [Rhododendron griersonianum]|uniref:Uncharacterized protein n=1 Tax=Rhododendron griersonianum TaxID=479676 RepID=A0AAV6K866_9ERIC|nr:hypothetical protein RHGRI_014129 [Rhododendron griersonianum]
MLNTTPDLGSLYLRCYLNPLFFIPNSSSLNPSIRAEAKLNGNDNGAPFVGTEDDERRSTGGERDLFKAPEAIIEKPAVGFDPMTAAISMISCKNGQNGNGVSNLVGFDPIITGFGLWGKQIPLITGYDVNYGI